MAQVQFGLNISTTVEDGFDPVDEARLAEAMGFDFVSANDHMHAAGARYECWTLLAWLAANTSRVRVASRVLGVPYRAPAVTAKMAETLARLSRGRLILGLGAGSGDGEFTALGLGTKPLGTRLAGLEEAVRITRGLWSPGPFSFSGSMYGVDKADVQPKPEQSIPIWLGTHGPRGLEVTGRLADGWIPSAGSLSPDRVPEASAAISDAAIAAGRDPTSITRIYNVEVSLDEEQRSHPGIISGDEEGLRKGLAELLDLGFNGFNLIVVGRDRRGQIKRIASEVIPDLGSRG